MGGEVVVRMTSMLVERAIKTCLLDARAVEVIPTTLYYSRRCPDGRAGALLSIDE